MTLPQTPSRGWKPWSRNFPVTHVLCLIVTKAPLRERFFLVHPAENVALHITRLGSGLLISEVSVCVCLSVWN